MVCDWAGCTFARVYIQLYSEFTPRDSQNPARYWAFPRVIINNKSQEYGKATKRRKAPLERERSLNGPAEEDSVCPSSLVVEIDCKLRQHLLLPANHTYRCRYFWSNDWVVHRGFNFQADPSRLRFVRRQKGSLWSLDEDDEREIADFFTKLIHRSWDSSTSGREVFALLKKTIRQTDRQTEPEIWDTPEERRPGTARISFPSGFIEAENRPLVEEKSLFAWRRRPDRQRTRDRDLRHSWRETARYSADFFSKRIHRSRDSSTGGREVFVRLTKTTRQTDREPEREIWDNPEERQPGTANTKGTSSSSKRRRRK